MNTKNGSILYNKYNNVHIGALINFDTNVHDIKLWLRNNLFFRQEMKDTNSPIFPVDRDYCSEHAFRPKTVAEVCQAMNINETTTYTTKEGEEKRTENVKRSFVMEPVFQTNDSSKRKEQDYCPNRLSIVEMDLIHHPRYGEIEDLLQELKDQVCAYAKKLRNNGKRMNAKLTVLYSRPGGQAQVLHRDDNANDGSRKYVMSCIVALQEKTSLEFAHTLHSDTRDTITFSSGTYIYFCGSQIHAGAAYNKPNLRIHFYIHEDETVLEKIFDGNIYLSEYCQVEDCDFCTSSKRYLRYRHYPLKHSEWWKERLEGKREKNIVKKDEKDGHFYCLANPKCENHYCKTADGIRKHYKTHHTKWWLELQIDRKFCKKNDDGTYSCLCPTPCDDDMFESSDELKDHYNRKHKKWWNDVRKKGKKHRTL